MTPDTPYPARPVVLTGALAALLAFAALNALAMARGVGGFEYPLDDVYIHLAMAEQIAAGGYGVNAGEVASAASSPLYPLLLVPFANTGLQVWLPLFWNIVAVMGAGALFGAALARAGFGWLGILFAAIAPVTLNMYVAAFTGMENMAHGTASLMIVVGLWYFVETRRLNLLLIAGVFLAPALRLEGLALALAAGGLVVVLGRQVSGLLLMLLALAPVVAFAGFLTSQGLDPLPNSVIAKLTDSVGSDSGNIFRRIADRLAVNFRMAGGQLLAAVTFVLAVGSLTHRQKDQDRALFGLAVAAAGVAHLAFGSIGWMDRYENYILLATVAALVLVLADTGIAVKGAALALAMGGGLLTYLPLTSGVYIWNTAAMQLQQQQMGRFVKEYVQEPIAVNDLGQVSWRNPEYVLDLWGLASAEALETRLSNPPDGWAGPLVAARDVPLIMIYDRWLGEAVDPTWVPLGQLVLDVPRALIGGFEVTFYAATPDDVTRLQAALAEWVPTLPDRATFVYAEGGN